MKRVSILVRQTAEEDALGYYHYICDYNPDAASRFLECVDRTIEGLALQPFKGRLRHFKGRGLKNIRSWRVDHFENYLIFYRFDEAQVEVLRIKHGAMDFPQALHKV